MSDLRDLYQELIIDHSKNPRNFRVIDEPDRVADGLNPLCGDKLRLYLKVDDEGIIRDAAFEGAGCAISTASASIMTTLIKNQSLEQAEKLFETFHALVTHPEHVPDNLDLGKMAVFAGVNEFPARVKCATLAWHTMKNAVADSGQEAKTE